MVLTCSSVWWCNPVFAASVADGYGPFMAEDAGLGITSAPLMFVLKYPLGFAAACYERVSATMMDVLWSDQPLYSDGATRLAKATATVVSRILESDWSMEGDEVIT
jgi:hypothetical protein